VPQARKARTLGNAAFMAPARVTVVAAAQVRALVRENGAQLAFIERAERASSENDAALAPGETVGSGHRMPDDNGAQPLVELSDQRQPAAVTAAGRRRMHQRPRHAPGDPGGDSQGKHRTRNDQRRPATMGVLKAQRIRPGRQHTGHAWPGAAHGCHQLKAARGHREHSGTGQREPGGHRQPRSGLGPRGTSQRDRSGDQQQRRVTEQSERDEQVVQTGRVVIFQSLIDRTASGHRHASSTHS